MNKPGTRIVLWVAAAAGAVAVGTAAIGASIGARPAALSQDEVARQLAAAGTGTSTTANPTTANPTPTGTGRVAAATTGSPGVLNTVPGTVVASCSAGSVWLVTWSPNPGYRADDVWRGPAGKASIEFESDVADDVMVEVVCAGDKPIATVIPEADDHGGGHDDDHSGRGRDHPEDD